ncbi:AAA family ATPase [Neorhodopirellula pilleata]|uniref:ATPase AAA-type core domain-containing protein n=1 Tax=Neorhodopirellula pilleata TaxID=2714738 RepID=A0A5C6AVB0_9BACT|nr:AAA family ATPase [Neorhodopirellula pilleata]TWU03381.1 hypothetical protein Pla100_03020 [Neorhodopirellula pilleata]
MLSIEEIMLPESVASDYDADPPFNSLRHIRRLNAFIGPNNSGKSRLMRALFLAGTNLMVSTDDEDTMRVREAVRNVLPESECLSRHQDVVEKANEALANVSFGFHSISQHIGKTQQNVKLFAELANQVNRLRSHQSGSFDRQPYDNLVRSLQTIVNGMERLESRASPRSMNHNQNHPTPEPHFRNAEFVYVPTLRGMRLGVDDDNSKFAYFDRTWVDYIKGNIRQGHSQKDDINQARTQMSGKTVFTGLDLYDVLTDRLLGSLADRQFIRQYEEYLSKAFFRDQPVALIPRREHDTVNIKIGTEAERPVQSLGDGLQQLIILTLPMFERREKPLFLFIEEPDLFLHPGFQRAFIDAIFDHPNPDLYVFVTTHSNQFLDITISEEGCSIFRCGKQAPEKDHPEHDPRFTVSNATTGDHELLKHIGVRPSSVMFANCTIWVEGITDRLYYGKFLELMLADRSVNLIENMHYAFVEYGGGNITHWSFLDEEDGMDVERICSRLFLITDKDDGKDERHQRLAEVLDERFHRLDVREVENLLTPATIKAVIHDYEKETIALHDFAQTAYRLNYLGKFIDDQVLPDASQSKRFSDRTKSAYADKSGTIKDKVRFCQKALSHLQTVDDLSDGAKEVAEKLYRFVVSEND